MLEEAQTTLYAQLEALDSNAPDYQQQSRALMTAYRAAELDIPAQRALPVMQSFLLVAGISNMLDDAAPQLKLPS